MTPICVGAEAERQKHIYYSDMGARKMKYVRAFGVIVGVVMTAACTVYFLLPGFRRYLLNEDNLVENLTAVLFLGAFVLSVHLLGRGWRGPQRRLFAVLTVLALFCLLDEISYGARFLGLRVPAVLGHKIDGVHDLVDCVYILIAWSLPRYTTVVSLVLGGVMIFVCVTGLAYRRELSQCYCRLRTRESGVLLVLFAILMVTCIVLDFDIVESRFSMMIEEALEMSCALALVFALLCLRRELTETQQLQCFPPPR